MPNVPVHTVLRETSIIRENNNNNNINSSIALELRVKELEAKLADETEKRIAVENKLSDLEKRLIAIEQQSHSDNII